MRLSSPAARRAAASAVAAALVALAVAASIAAPPADVPVAPRAYGGRPSVEDLTTLGRELFADRGLSASGRIACATCHEPAAAFGPGRGASSPFADGDPAHAGTRAIPSLRYARYARRFTEHFIDDEDGHGDDAGPTGGLTWDGRADSAREQSRLPLFAAQEMGNADAAGVARRVAAAGYAEAFRRAFSAPGRDVFDDPRRVVDWVALALEVYEQAPEFAPFTSRYDRVLAGRATLSGAEARGLALFEDPAKGNCASCHPSRPSAAGAAPLFTDAGFIALGVPRRAGLPAGRPQRAYPVASLASGPEFDLGLCRSGRPGLGDDPSYCGRFRAPSLRNVALRPSFFHNGALRSLRDAVAFYATRDTDPARWYPVIEGSVRRYDDLPPEMARFVHREPPFQPLPDGRPRLDDRDIDDIVAFLDTLTDARTGADADAAR